MLVNNHARMLAVAPGGWDRCIGRCCRGFDPSLTRSARTIERRLLATEIADAVEEALDTSPWLVEDIVPTSRATSADIAEYWADRAQEDESEIQADLLYDFFSCGDSTCELCW